MGMMKEFKEFVIVAFAVFLLVRAMNNLKGPKPKLPIDNLSEQYKLTT